MEKQNVLDDVKRILDNDEVILRNIKPNKKRFILISNLSFAIFFLLFIIPFTIIGIGGIVGFISFTNETGEKDLLGPIMFLVFASLPLIFFLIKIISVFPIYKNTYYFVTNKRIIIRSGFIGVDYKALSLKNIIVTNVRVDFLDKLVNPNPGSIIFGSAATQLSADQNSKVSSFMFAHIDNPYDEYKAIKEIIDAESAK